MGFLLDAIATCLCFNFIFKKQRPGLGNRAAINSVAGKRIRILHDPIGSNETKSLIGGAGAP
jgi:hypothetical protein